MSKNNTRNPSKIGILTHNFFYHFLKNFYKIFWKFFTKFNSCILGTARVTRHASKNEQRPKKKKMKDRQEKTDKFLNKVSDKLNTQLKEEYGRTPSNSSSSEYRLRPRAADRNASHPDTSPLGSVYCFLFFDNLNFFLKFICSKYYSYSIAYTEYRVSWKMNPDLLVIFSHKNTGGPYKKHLLTNFFGSASYRGPHRFLKIAYI